MSQKGSLVSTEHTKPAGEGMRQVNLIVHGATGRMGRRIMDLAGASSRWRVVAAASRAGLSAVKDSAQGAGAQASLSPQNAQDMANLADCADLVIDFSSDEGARAAAAMAQRIGCALLTGSTGLSQPTIDALRELAARAPVLVAPNTSRAVAVVARLAAQAAALGKDFDPVIIETHHTAKRDAPSGTAIRLAEAMRAAGAYLPDNQVISVRAGHVVGEHIIRFEGRYESVEIIHRAFSRDVFAAGALDAGLWLIEQAPGWYAMEDVLGFVPDAGMIAARSRK
ncbi:MAG: 4-hydroxy-tetrahydrodipicolinate reductase [Phycisphaerales bacterium JB039]